MAGSFALFERPISHNYLGHNSLGLELFERPIREFVFGKDIGQRRNLTVPASRPAVFPQPGTSQSQAVNRAVQHTGVRWVSGLGDLHHIPGIYGKCASGSGRVLAYRAEEKGGLRRWQCMCTPPV